ncbi:MAG: PD-(D/E)XK nuclease family transposase [Bacteroidota bacterium]
MKHLQNRQIALQEKIIEKLLKTAEIATFTVQERREYEDNLKYYRDMVNIVDSAKNERAHEIAITMKKKGFSVPEISELTGLSEDQVRLV